MRIWPLSGAGLIGAVALGSLTVLPSLIPRSAAIQGLLMGVCAAIGYGVVTAAWAVSRQPHPRARWWLLAVPIAALLLGWRWQGDLSKLTQMPAPAVTWVALSGIAAVVVFLLLLACGRGVRWLTDWLARTLQRLTSPRLATAGAATASALVLLVAAAQAPVALTNGLQPVFTRMNNAPGAARPASAFVSGGPDSQIPWQALGAQGRSFVGGVTAASALQAFSGRPARSPIRVFVGMDSAASAQQRAQLAVSELERFGAFDRAVIAVGTSAGSGTVDQGEVTPLEYLLNGDVATVSTQYSLLPSFLSFLVDQPDSVEAATTLLDAVRARAAQQPNPPRIVVFGESLGAYGSSGTFLDLQDVLRQVDGAMWQGPPNSTRLWQTLTENRQPGSPEIRPVYGDGRNVRWVNQPSDLALPAGPFDPPRLVFVQNASDPVVWWSPQVLWQRPDWMAEPRGPGVLNTPWLPLITFAGLTGDMLNSQGVPAGHGHVYGTSAVYVWADILRPTGWTTADTQRLAEHLG